MSQTITVRPYTGSIRIEVPAVARAQVAVVGLGARTKFATAFGDGAATSYTITHNLGTRDVHVAVYRNSGSYDQVAAVIRHSTTNAVTVEMSVAPTLNQFRCVVIG